MQPLQIFTQQYRQMLSHVQYCAPLEACGIIAGSKNTAKKIFPIDNILHSTSRYQMHPEQFVRAFWKIEERGWQVTAFYHSHPAGPPTPSPSDLLEARYPFAIWVICWPQTDGWQAGAYLIENQSARSIPLKIVADKFKEC